MQINLDFTPGTYTVRSYATGEIIVRTPPNEKTVPADTDDLSANSLRFNTSLVISPRQLMTTWAPQTVSQITETDLEMLSELKPELVLLGTGARQIFPPPKLLTVLNKYRIGLEVMDTGAACRTYNFLVADGRQVAAALMMIR